jgi:hypothetical protein
MPRLYLPLVPVALLAAIAAASACSRSRVAEEGDNLRVVPPPAAYVAAPAPELHAASTPLAPSGAATGAVIDAAPSAEEVSAFEASGRK